MNTEKQCHKIASVRKNILQTMEQPIETEFLVPEYCPDIARILKCEMTPRLVSKSVSGGTMIIDGCAEIDVIFCGEDGKISSVLTKFNFTKTVDDPSFSDGYVMVKLKNGHLSCRQTTARRIEIRGSVCIDIAVAIKEDDEIICDIEDQSAQLLRKSETATTELGFSEKTAILEEEIMLGAGQPEIKYVLRQNAVAMVSECKIISDKAVVKGNVKVEIIYCSVEDRPVCHYAMVPFSQIVDITTEGEDCTAEADAEITALDVKPRTGGDGITNYFVVTIKLNVGVQSFCESEIPIIADAYSTKYKTELATKDLMVKKRVDSINEKIMVKKTLDFSEGQIMGVADVWCSAGANDVRFDGKEMIISGMLNVCVLAYSAEDCPEYFERNVEFEYRTMISEAFENMACEPKIYPVDCSYTLLGSGQIELQAELQVCANVYIQKKVPCVTDVSFNEENEMGDEAIIAYFCDKGESLWDISKKFCASLQNIKEQNNLTDDIVNSPLMLIIPRM